MEEFITYPLLKSLHIIFIVTWFAGLFYIVRLFIYHVEAQSKNKIENDILSTQYKLMEKRLWYFITWPSMIITLIVAPTLLYKMGLAWTLQTRILLKLGFVVCLIVYHLICHQMYKQLQKNIFKYSSTKLRVWNEVATLLLFIIVFLIVYPNLNFYKGLFSFIGLALILFLGIKLYKKTRKDEVIDEYLEEQAEENTKQENN